MFYLVVFLTLLFLVYRYDYCRKEQGKMIWLAVVLLAFIFIAGLRYRIGVDSIRYERYFESMPTIDNLKLSDFDNTRFQPLFIILSSLIRTITPDFTAFQMFHSIVVNGVIVWFVYKHARNPFFALTLFFVFLYLNLLTEVLRESLAVSVFLLSWPFFRDGKWLKWYMMSVICFLCHMSGIMMFFLPIICIPGIRQLFVFGKRTAVICAILVVVTVAVQLMFFRYVQALAVSENMAEQAEIYSKNELSGSTLNFGGILGQVVRYILYPVLAIYFLHKGRAHLAFVDTNEYKKEEMMSLMSIYITIVSLVIMIMSRFNNYFFLFSILIISDFIFTRPIISSRQVRFKFIYWLLFFVPLFSYQIYGAYFANANKSGSLKVYMTYYPYSSRLDMTKDPNREKLFRYVKAY